MQTAPRFTTPDGKVPRVDTVRFGNFWVFDEPLVYVGSITVEIPAGFTTDFASIPKALWWLFEPDDPRWCAAAGVHDRAYEQHLVSRLIADATLLEAMSVPVQPTGVACASPKVRCAFYRGVRLGGGSSYMTAPARQVDRKAAYEVWPGRR